MKNKNTNKREKKKETIQVPEIFGENVYFKYPGVNAHTRRNNEAKYRAEAKEFFKKNKYTILGIYTENRNAIKAEIKTPKGLICVRFSYSESCNNVYKRLSVYLDDTKKDIRLIKKKSTYLTAA